MDTLEMLGLLPFEYLMSYSPYGPYFFQMAMAILITFLSPLLGKGYGEVRVRGVVTMATPTSTPKEKG